MVLSNLFTAIPSTEVLKPTPLGTQNYCTVGCFGEGCQRTDPIHVQSVVCRV